MAPRPFRARPPTPPTDDDLAVARYQGRRVTQVAKALKSRLTARSRPSQRGWPRIRCRIALDFASPVTALACTDAPERGAELRLVGGTGRSGTVAVRPAPSWGCSRSARGRVPRGLRPARPLEAAARRRSVPAGAGRRTRRKPASHGARRTRRSSRRTTPSSSTPCSDGGTMHHFAYRDGVLHAEDVDLAGHRAATSARRSTAIRAPRWSATTGFSARAFGRPADARLLRHEGQFQPGGAARCSRRLGAGMDVVSEGELRRARAAGDPAGAITFSGVGKTRARDRPSRSTRTSSASTSSPRRSSTRCRASRRRRGPTARIALRVNPDIDARTHAKISTGKAENKFGIPLGRARDRLRARRPRCPASVTGVDMHIGSQITDLEPFDNAFAVLADLVATLRADGHAIDHVDVGGGLGIPTTRARTRPPSTRPLCRPGAASISRRSSVTDRAASRAACWSATPASSSTAVVLVKTGEAKTFVVVDAAMNDLIRPTLYEAHHEIRPVRRGGAGAATGRADVVGPVCETGDYLALARDLPACRAGRPPGRHFGRRLWGGAGRHLQFAAARPRGDGRRAELRRRSGRGAATRR